jgi:hypothetical protein
MHSPLQIVHIAVNRAATRFSTMSCPPAWAWALLGVGFLAAGADCAFAQAVSDTLGTLDRAGPAGIAETAAAAAIAASPAPGEVRLTSEVSAIQTRLAPPAASPWGPNGERLTDLAAINYRLWMSRGRAAVGVGVGTVGYVQPSPDGHGEGPVSLVAPTPTVSLDVRYRMTRHSALYAGAIGARGLGVDTGREYVNTKVGVEWKPARSTFGFDHGAFGLRLDSGYRLSLKARHGGLAIYLRGKF